MGALKDGNTMSVELNFEIRDKDIGARIGRLEINKKYLETPSLMPVYNPSKPIIPVKELKSKFKMRILMVNSYMLLRNSKLGGEVLDVGIHRYLGFNGLIASDSGSYQLMNYGGVSTTNREIIEFQERIGSDIGAFLDVPSLPDAYKPRAAEQLELTLKRSKEAEDVSFVFNAGFQGSTYMDLRKKAAREIGGKFRLCAIGGIVRLMEEYRFNDLVDVIATVKKNIPLNRVVHAFGFGHPMAFSLAAALGCDLFDSAAYALYANDLRYMTEYGTKRLDSLEYLPCSCPVCSKHGIGLKELPEDEKIRNLAMHNLYVSLEELDRVRQAIKEGSLWELLSIRMRSHPQLLSGFERLRRYGNWLSELDPITKKSPFYYSGSESRHRTEVLNVRKRIGRVSSDNRVRVPPFGRIPIEVLDVYPFGSFGHPEGLEIEEPCVNVRDMDRIRGIMEYQFGPGASELMEDSFRIKKSRRTGRIRWIYQGKELIASVRASDHFIIPKKYLADKLKDKFKYPKLRVVVDDDAVSFISEGKSVFAKFVADIDPELRVNDEVLVVDKRDDLIRLGTLILSPREVRDFSRGVAVRVR
jgi:7-cyano-7-deazaguanine tRNA-ribosyltransferase